MNINIGANIKRLRTAKNITQEQLSVAMNVTCAAVSKWERGETYPDITLLLPLAYYFGISLDELMGYDQEKIQAEIDEAVTLYKKYWKSDYTKARDIITNAYHSYPNDYSIMHYYMWNIGGDMADNDPNIIIAHKDEFLEISSKILDGCADEEIRLNAWNMQAKILHAEGKTRDALDIYNTKFSDWYGTRGQKCEQLFSKDTSEYYLYVRKNMYELADFVADKLGRAVFFDPTLSIDEKTKHALHCNDALVDSFKETDEDFFLVLAASFLGRIENDLYYRGGSDENVISVMEKNLQVINMLSERLKENDLLREYYNEDILKSNINLRSNPAGKRADLMKKPAYIEVLNKYK